MTTPDNSTGGHGSGDHSRDDILAGEYVLGVLSLQDRRMVEARMRDDQAFSAKISAWQDNFSSLNEAYEPARPDAAVFSAIEGRLFGGEISGQAPSWWNSLLIWRGLTAVTTMCAVVAIAAVSVLTRQLPEDSGAPMVAELSSPGGSMALLASYDAQSGRMHIMPAAYSGEHAQSLEVWMVPADGVPKSLGVIEPGHRGEIIVPEEMRDSIGDGMTLAISVEPFGGSPTGLPTGPVIASGITRQS